MVDNIKNLFDAFMIDAKKAEGGNVAAGRRARKASLEIANKLKEFRKDSMDWGKKE